MNYESAIASGVVELDAVSQFQKLFPDAEHVIVQGKRDFDPDGWQLVREWISRVSLYNRYVIWLVVAIDVAPNGIVSALDEPEIYIIEVENVEKGRDDKGGPKWECSFGQIEADDWQEIVDAGADFASLGVELTVDDPVDRFATFWHDTRPAPDAPAPDGIALKAPLRFTS